MSESGTGSGERPRTDPSAFRVEDNWRGGYYELAIELAPGDDARLQAVLDAVWTAANVQGCFACTDREPHEQDPVPRTVAALTDEPVLDGRPQRRHGLRVPWAELRVSADNPCQNVDRYRGKRIFLTAGDSPKPMGEIPFVGTMTEGKVLRGQQDFGALLTQAGIPNQVAARIGGEHDIDRPQIAADLAGITSHLLPAV
jgi:hypothetical protein